MSKPICVIYVPDNINIGGKIFTYSDGIEIAQGITKLMQNEYYVFVFPSELVGHVEFRVYYDKDFTEANYNELKSIIESAIKKGE